MGKGVLRVDLKALSQALCLPEGYRLVAVQQTSFAPMLALLVESSAIREVDESELYPELTAIMHVDVLPDSDPRYRRNWVDIQEVG